MLAVGLVLIGDTVALALTCDGERDWLMDAFWLNDGEVLTLGLGEGG